LTLFLADTSAWWRSGASADIAQRWFALLEDDSIATCIPIELELLWSARNPAAYVEQRDELAGLVRLRIDHRVEERARETQAALAARSQHRGPTPVDLLIAAVADTNDATLLHYDRHFDVVCGVTGQPSRWLARRGTLT
jgi:predicted nucleic acid-binding protein